MAYATSAPPRLVEQVIAGPRVWYYTNTDADTDVDASGYFSNGYDIGMRDGDLLRYYKSDTKVYYTGTVLNTSGTTINMANFVAETSATDSD